VLWVLSGQEGLIDRFVVLGSRFVTARLYTLFICKGVLRFFNKVALLLIKNKKIKNAYENPK